MAKTKYDGSGDSNPNKKAKLTYETDIRYYNAQGSAAPAQLSDGFLDEDSTESNIPIILADGSLYYSSSQSPSDTDSNRTIVLSGQSSDDDDVNSSFFEQQEEN